MNLYRRLYGVLKVYWRQLLTASTSSALHAVFSGALIWMAGPLLMTLFGVDSSVDFITGSGTESVAGSARDTLSGHASGWLEGLTETVSGFRETLKGWVYALVTADSRQDTVVRFCWLILLIGFAKNLFLYVQGFFMAFVQQSVIRFFRDRLFEKYHRLSLDYFHRRRTGQIISRVTNDVLVLNESLDIGFNRLITDIISLFMFLVFLIILSWKLTLLSMVIMPVVFGFIWFIGRKLRKYSERSQEKMADVNSVLEESVNNMRIVKAFSMEDFETKKFFGATREYFRSLLRMTRIRYLSSPINDILATVAGVFILLFAGTRIIAGTGELDAGDFMTFVLVLFSLIKPVKTLSQVHIRLQEGLAAADRIFQVLDAEEKVTEPAKSRSIDSLTDAIRYENLGFEYIPGEPVLRDVSFEVKMGEVVAIVGPSGAGKSTLLDLLPRFYDPQQGRVAIDGIDIRELNLKSLRGLMGVVTQDTLLFNDTVAANIAYGLNGASTDRIEEVARAANAHRFIVQLPEGYNTVVGNRGMMLSGGQKQRLAIARALLRDPQVLIFDEATSALDTESEMLVQEAIDRLMADRTTLVVAHRLSTIKNADRIIVLEDGLIVESGDHDCLMKNDGLYRRLHDMQFRQRNGRVKTH